jgi:ribokinase
MATKTILVIGSSNTDLVVNTCRFPLPGETILADRFFMNPGGKGANQAVAASRLGAKVILIAKLGDDLFGQAALESLKKEGIETKDIFMDKDTASGIALITVDQNGENNIVVAPGANMNLSAVDIDMVENLIAGSDIILTQLEIPVKTILHIAMLAKKHGKKMVLNPAPATELPQSILTGLYLLTPNETEAALLTGIRGNTEAQIKEMALTLLDRGVENVIITLGKKGAFFLNRDQQLWVAAPPVKPVDSTAAGDVFNGSLAHFLVQGANWSEAISQACKAASFSVTKLGAQSSAPTQDDLAHF